MPRYPETQALLEQAVRHVLSEQEKLLKRPDVGELNGVLQALNQLAIDTSKALAEGFSPSISTTHLTKRALRIERIVDDVSESLWTQIPVSVLGIYERIEESLKRRPGKGGLVAEIRAHYHNLRIGLLEQMIGARMLVLPSDLGDETERIWQQFLERQLGPSFRVLRGGHIVDHDGNSPPQQIDLIVVPSDAYVFVPGDSEGGKAQVLIDQVISVIEITANLTVEKLKQDWGKLQSLPPFADLENDFPHLKGHSWPLSFILAAHSDSAEDLKRGWCELCQEGLTQMVPQLVLSLDTGYLYSGARRWPAPRFPGNYVEVDQVNIETDIYAGLGLAWLITQHQGRLAAIRRQALGPITRLAKLLDEAMLREGVPPTDSHRFNEKRLQPSDIAGALSWGASGCFAHNRLPLSSLSRNRGDVEAIYGGELFQAGVDPKSLTWPHWDSLRWFRYGKTHIAGKLLAVEEWIAHKSKTENRLRIAVFDTVSGEEIEGPDVEALNVVIDVEALKSRYE